jgi:hypothetical protein
LQKKNTSDDDDDDDDVQTAVVQWFRKLSKEFFADKKHI